MAEALMLKHKAILSLFVFLLLALHFSRAVVSAFEYEESDDEEYVVDSVPAGNSSRRSRFLTTSPKKTIRKGTRCDAETNPYVCNGVSVNNGTGLLYCCKKHCRNVLEGDRNNCGRCGHKCRLLERCCSGVCTSVFDDVQNCGKCQRKCPDGVKCEFGYCGYA